MESVNFSKIEMQIMNMLASKGLPEDLEQGLLNLMTTVNEEKQNYRAMKSLAFELANTF